MADRQRLLIVVGLTGYLALRGWEVDTANDYETAKKLLRAGGYAVALVDLLITAGTKEHIESTDTTRRRSSAKPAPRCCTRRKTSGPASRGRCSTPAAWPAYGFCISSIFLRRLSGRISVHTSLM